MGLREQGGRETDALDLLGQYARLAPNELDPILALASVHKKLGHMEESAKFAVQARALILSDDWYNLACLESVAGNVDMAIEHLRCAASNPKFNRARAAHDPDLEWIRNDPRFQDIVGSS
jgi:hypothetical protein